MSDHALRRWRHAQKPRITLADLAERMRVKPSHLSQIETGIKNPSIRLAARLSEETGIPLESFVPQIEAAQ